MTASLASRGLALNDDLSGRIALLDTAGGIEDIRLTEILRLHAALAQAVSPALPETLELLLWEAGRQTSYLTHGGTRLPNMLGLSHWVAPVGAVRKVIWMALFFFCVFFAVIIFSGLTMQQVAGGLPAFNNVASVANAVAPVAPEDRGTIAALLALFASLAGIGACFYVLFDAHGYIAKGSYDPRLGQNYGIRIGLGLMAGILLSQVLPAKDGGEWTAIGRPVLAVVGGFSGQLVYNVLSKLVTALESIFEEDRNQAIARAAKEAEEAAAARLNRLAEERSADQVALLAQLRDASSPEAREVVLTSLTARMAGLPAPAMPVPASGAQIEGAQDAIATLRARADFLARIVDLLPESDQPGLRAELGRISDGLGRLDGLTQDGDFVAEALRLAASSGVGGPLRAALTKSLGRLAGPLSGLGVTPAGLAGAIVVIATQEAADAYRRWKIRVLGADYAPELMAVDPIDAGAVLQVMNGLGDDARQALGIDAGDMGLLNEFGRAALDLEADEVLSRYGAEFSGEAQVYLEAVARLRDGLAAVRMAALGAQVAEETPPEALRDTGRPDGQSLLALFDRLVAQIEPRAEIERILLLASATRDASPEIRQLFDQALARASAPAPGPTG
ncbi:hypothetical protein [Paracoccus litorisediminis]|uniref:Uncharacterized protein n=1 Tax=Paracoccus litorisediminis TaxID=2006130 RepID=A0A844HHS5_9RHOB|nr:hypothetical protein [Paracoccus litorisediminis]MTH59460.1 hypothetical protein [Paracoccus litorisediminis]